MNPRLLFSAQVLSTIALQILCVAQAQTLTAAKPSAYRTKTEHDARPAVSQPYLARLSSREEFEQLARHYNAGTPFELPHLLFVIDRKNDDRVYFINTRRFDLHEHFLTRGPLHLKLSHQMLAQNYQIPERRFLFGTLSWQTQSAQWTYEFWEGDRLNTALLQEAQTSLQRNFYAPLIFKANGRAHESIARKTTLDFVTQEALIQDQAFLPLNTGEAHGRIRLLRAGEPTAELNPQDIAILDEVPISLPPVAGIVTTHPSTAISHVNLLAKGWGIPNAWVRDAIDVFTPLNGQWVVLSVSNKGYQVQPAQAPTAKNKAQLQALPSPLLSHHGLMPLATLHAVDRVHCGAKAANLGEISAAKLNGVIVPDGFCIPYSYFAEFIRHPDAQKLIADTLATPDFERNHSVRSEALATLRKQLVALPLNPEHEAEWQTRWQTQLAGTGVFVRSSSNSEDLPHFSGAGLYSTIPNVTRTDALGQAVKEVWASIFNFEAFEARRIAGIPQEAVTMAVFVQRAIDSHNAGVMITRDPFDPSHRRASYIAAKRGIGIKVVEGRRVAEQLMYDARSDAIELLSQTAESTELHLDAEGGVREQPSTRTGHVLSDQTVRQLATIGSRIQRLFGGQDQDIEWATTAEGKIVILQARPYGTRTARKK